jgi:hypothetical protein
MIAKAIRFDPQRVIESTRSWRNAKGGHESADHLDFAEMAEDFGAVQKRLVGLLTRLQFHTGRRTWNF